MNVFWKKILEKFFHDFKGFSKNEEHTTINKAVVEMAITFNLRKGDIKDLLQVVLEELTYEEKLKLEYSQRRNKRKGNCRKKEEPSRKLKSLAGVFADLNNPLKKFKTLAQHQKAFINKEECPCCIICLQ